MRPVALSDDIAVGEMPAAEQFAILAKAGFRSVLNVQPDEEVGRLIGAEEAGDVARSSGMAYVYLPIATRRMSDAQAKAFASAMAELPRPIYACCYSGARAAAGWAMAIAPTMDPAAIVAACAAAGYDMSSLQGEIARRHAGLPEPEVPAADMPAPMRAVPPIATVAAEAAPAAAAAPTLPSQPVSAAAAVTAAERIIYPRAAGAGGFAVSG